MDIFSPLHGTVPTYRTYYLFFLATTKRFTPYVYWYQNLDLEPQFQVFIQVSRFSYISCDMKRCSQCSGSGSGRIRNYFALQNRIRNWMVSGIRIQNS